MKIYIIIVIILSAVGIYAISLILKAWRGIKTKNGFPGMVLLLMPHSLGIVTFPERSGYFVATLILSTLGIFLFASDIPRVEKTNKN